MITINVLTNNEVMFVPKLWGNEKLPFQQQFKVYLRRRDQMLRFNNWIADGKFSLSEKLKDCIVKFENPPMLVNEKKENIELTVEILVSEKYKGLDDLILAITERINEMQGEKVIETKNF